VGNNALSRFGSEYDVLYVDIERSAPPTLTAAPSDVVKVEEVPLAGVDAGSCRTIRLRPSAGPGPAVTRTINRLAGCTGQKIATSD
jgi:hypothetical protein